LLNDDTTFGFVTLDEAHSIIGMYTANDTHQKRTDYNSFINVSFANTLYEQINSTHFVMLYEEPNAVGNNQTLGLFSVNSSLDLVLAAKE